MLATVRMPQWPGHLVLGGERFTLVCVRRSGVSVYRGQETYLRIGPGFDSERRLQQAMLDRDYPVPRLLDTGEYDGMPYAVEESLGTTPLDDLFEPRREAGEAIPATDFAVLTDVVQRLARAQVAAAEPSTATSSEAMSGFADMIGVRSAASSTGHGARLLAVFDEAVASLSELPVVLLHGDLHESNLCRGGVIDLEGSGSGPAGYDVTTAVFIPAMSAPMTRPLGPARGWYGEEQVATYLSVVDQAFTAGEFRPASRHLDAFLLCRAIALCAHRHRDDAIWRLRQGVLDAALDAIATGGDVRSAVLGQAG